MTAARELVGMDAAAFTRFAGFIHRRQADLASRVPHHATVAPSGPTGARWWRGSTRSWVGPRIP